MQGDTQSFIVRIWHEALDDQGNIVAWRGSIDHVGGDTRLYFQDLDGVVRFIQQETGIAVRRPARAWRWLLSRIGQETT